jgi:uncharacterized protein (TIGR00106 family)
VSARSDKAVSRTRPGPAPGTEGLSPLDTDRAASLADEGGASAAATETQERDRSEGASMLFELSILPLGEVHMSDEIADVLDVIERSGLPYKLSPGSTYIEGTWDQVLPVIRACHACARGASRHVITWVRIEDDEGQPNKIRSNVESVEAKAGHKLERSL